MIHQITTKERFIRESEREERKRLWNKRKPEEKEVSW